MKKIFTLSILIVLSVTGFAQSSILSSTTDDDVLASFTSFDLTGCIRTDVGIQAYNLRRTDNGIILSSHTGMGIQVTDECSGAVLMAANGFSTKQELVVDKKLGKATLKVNVTLVDWNGIGFLAHIEMQWRTTDAITSSDEGSDPTNGLYVLTESVPAKATGSIYVSYSSTYKAIQNATPNPSYEGMLIRQTTTQYSTGVRMEENISASNDLVVYPNPVTTSATLLFNSANQSNYELAVTDVTGKILLHSEGKTVFGENIVNIDLSGFAAGMYFVTVSNGDGIRTLKLVKE